MKVPRKPRWKNNHWITKDVQVVTNLDPRSSRREVYVLSAWRYVSSSYVQRMIDYFEKYGEPTDGHLGSIELRKILIAREASTASLERRKAGSMSSFGGES